MKKNTKTLLSLTFVAMLFAFAATNAVHTLKNTNRLSTDFSQSARENMLFRKSADAIYGTTQQLMGKKGLGGVHFASGSLIERPSAYNEVTVDKNIAEVAEFAKNTDFNVTLAVIPSAFEIMRDSLPYTAYDDRELKIFERLHISLDGTKTMLCDTRSALERHSDEEIYYRTDSHLTSLGSYYVFSELGEALQYGANRIDDFEREVAFKSFRGDLYEKAPTLLIKSDTIEKFILPGSLDQTLKYKGGLRDTIYDDAYGYTIFPGGNHDVEIITSQCGSGRKLAVIKDSYANSIVPFLANHFDSVHLINLSYFNTNLQKYLTDNEINDVLIIYSADNFNTNEFDLIG